ncbi:MAG: LacI family DNA-binding transcriptional regulator, partial [bacterium]
MSTEVSIKDVARVAEVSVAAVSYTLNGKGDRYRIGRDTQERIRTGALRLGYQANSLARDIRMGNWHPVDSAGQTPAIRREVGLVVGAGSPASSLALIPGQELLLATEGFTTVIVALPADGEGTRRRLADLVTARFIGILCCPSLFTTVSSAVANQYPLIALSPWAAKTLLGKPHIAATRADTPIPPAAPLQSAPTTKPLPPSPVVVTESPPVIVPEPTPVADPTPTPAPVPVVVPEPAPTPTTEVPPPLVVPEPEPPAPVPTPVVVEPIQEPAPAPAVVESEAPPAERPEPVAEVPSPVVIPEPPPVIVPEPTPVADPTPTPAP